MSAIPERFAGLPCFVRIRAVCQDVTTVLGPVLECTDDHFGRQSTASRLAAVHTAALVGVGMVGEGVPFDAVLISQA